MHDATRFNPTRPTGRAALAVLALAAAAFGQAQAQVSINQAAAMAGGVTPGDAPGFPIFISQPGHYVLTGPLKPPLYIPAINVEAHDVTIDLGGHVISSDLDCTHDLNSGHVGCNMVWMGGNALYDRAGIRSISKNTRVRNGTVRGFLGHGLVGAALVENLRVASNAGSGIVVSNGTTGPAQMARVVGVQVELNAGSGVQGRFVVIDRSVLSKNGEHGAWIGGATVRDSVLSFNGGHGIAGSATQPSTLRGSDLVGNKDGVSNGGVQSLGGNFNGNNPF